MHTFRTITKLVAALCAVFLVGSVLVSAPAGAQRNTIYVATNGNDANSGSKGNPKATIAAAARSLNGGGTVYVRGGSYTISNGSGAITSGGSKGDRLVVRSQPGERARLTSINGNYCLQILADYVTVRNFDCTGAKGIGSWNANNVVIRNNYVHNITDSRTQGILASGDQHIRNIKINKNRVYRVPHTGIAIGSTRAGAGTNVEMKKNTVIESNYEFRNTPASAGGWGSGISAVGVNDALIKGNKVRRTYGEGINCALSNNCRVKGNVGVDAYGTIFYGDNATNSLWEDNMARTTDDPRFFRDYGFGGIEAAGYVIANEAGWFSGAGRAVSGNVFRNNVAVNVQVGWRFGEYGNGNAGMTDTIVANNTFVGTSICGIRLHSPSTNANNQVINNVVVPDAGSYALCGDDYGTTLRHNLWARGTVEGGLNPGDMRGMPTFTIGSGNKAKNYRLKANSRGVNDGVNTGYVTDDLTGKKRPKGGKQDMGAFERK